MKEPKQAIHFYHPGAERGFETVTLEQKYHTIEGDYPVDRSLVCIQTKIGEKFLGFMDWSDLNIYNLETRVSVPITAVSSYQYALNNKGGYYFINFQV